MKESVVNIYSEISKHDVNILRELATRKIEIAYDPVNLERMFPLAIKAY